MTPSAQQKCKNEDGCARAQEIVCVVRVQVPKLTEPYFAIFGATRSANH